MDIDYEEKSELYDQAVEALGYGETFQELEPEKKRKAAEVAETQAILNGDTGSLAGMDYLHTGSASD